jgi:hypothetical protein
MMRSMRTRLMNYTRSIPGGKYLRGKFSHVSSLMELDSILADYLTQRESLSARQEEEESVLADAE